MPAINLKDFFCRYTTDKFIDVSEEGPEELRTDKRYGATQRYPNHLCSVGFIPLEELTKAGAA